MTETATAAPDPTAALVARLARPHISGGMVIERAVILAEGHNSAAILSWISDHGGVADATAKTTRTQGLHGPRAGAAGDSGPPRRFLLPASAFIPTATS